MAIELALSLIQLINTPPPAVDLDVCSCCSVMCVNWLKNVHSYADVCREKKPPRSTEKAEGIACGFIICRAECRPQLAQSEDFNYSTSLQKGTAHHCAVTTSSFLKVELPLFKSKAQQRMSIADLTLCRIWSTWKSLINCIAFYTELLKDLLVLFNHRWVQSQSRTRSKLWGINKTSQ